MRTLVSLGLAALERGWITPEDLARAISSFHQARSTDARDHWLATERLSERQLDELTGERATHAAFQDALGGRPSTLPPPTARYAVEQSLREGGQGRILLSTDRVIGRRVALKVLHHEGQTPANARILAREAKVTGHLQHPSIIPVYDVGISDREGPFYVMPYVDQPSLEHVLAGLRRGDPGMVATWTLPRLLRTFVQVCQAVEYAHSRGVVHCDLKPDNILLGAFGEVLVGDWGFAYVTELDTEKLGGTPAYMAPEQIAGEEMVDARTDVFALGVVLYRILALRAPFAGARVSDLLRRRAIEQVPPRPSTLAPPDRVVPPELEDIALVAMAPEPAARYPSAHALAAAVMAFLEGTREREQRLHRAEGLIEQADELAARFHEGTVNRAVVSSQLAHARQQTEPWAPLAERRRVWAAEDELAVFDAVQLRILQEAIACYEQALAEQPGLQAARRGLARLYAEQLERARERRSTLDRFYFEGLLRQYDDEGILSRAGGRPGWINLELTGDVDDILLMPLDEVDRRQQPGAERRLRKRALAAVPAPPGSYQLVITHRGKRLCVPVLVRGDRETQVRLDLEAIRVHRDDETFIAGGTIAHGQDDRRSTHREPQGPHVAPFFMQTFPVTFGQYLTFLEDMLVEAPGRLAHLLPVARNAAPLWTVEGDRLVATPAHADIGLHVRTWRDVPVFGVDAMSAVGYADWWSRRTGHTYRLPTEREWEQAARGVDGRRFPWGDRFEALFCKMRTSRPGTPAPEPIGTFPADVSPYGVRDLGGGVADWCTPVMPDTDRSGSIVPLVSRGGAWSDSAEDCAVTARRRFQLDARSTRIGFRLVRDPTTE